MGVSGTSEEAFLASEISTKNNGWVEWAWGRQLVVNQPSSALVSEPRRQQLVAVLAVKQLSWYCRKPSRGVLRSRDVLSVGSVQGLHHLDAEVVMLADQLRGDLLGRASEEGVGEVLGGRGGYGGGLGVVADACLLPTE